MRSLLQHYYVIWFSLHQCKKVIRLSQGHDNLTCSDILNTQLQHAVSYSEIIEEGSSVHSCNNPNRPSVECVECCLSLYMIIINRPWLVQALSNPLSRNPRYNWSVILNTCYNNRPGLFYTTKPTLEIKSFITSTKNIILHVVYRCKTGTKLCFI